MPRAEHAGYWLRGYGPCSALDKAGQELQKSDVSNRSPFECHAAGLLGVMRVARFRS